MSSHSGPAPAPPPAPPETMLRATPEELTRSLVRIPSVNPDLEQDGAGEGAVARWIRAWLAGWGVEAVLDEPAPGRFNLRAVCAGASPGPRIVLNGHMDTVGVEGMTVEPFSAELRDGRIYGRGSCDMKAGLATILAATRAVVQAGGPARGELILALTADEEYASVGLAAMLDQGLEADRAIVFEPTELQVQPANKGFCWLELTIRGRAAHGSRPELGRDAIRAAGRILAALDRYELRLAEQPEHPLLGRGSIHAGTIRGGSAPPVYPERCDLVLEARTLPGESPADVRERFEGVFAELIRDHGIQVEVRMGLSRPAAEVPTDDPLVTGLSRALREEGREPVIGGMTAWVESAWFTDAGIPAVCFGPGSLGLAHTAEESVPVDEIELATRVLVRHLESELGSAGAP